MFHCLAVLQGNLTYSYRVVSILAQITVSVDLISINTSILHLIIKVTIYLSLYTSKHVFSFLCLFTSDTLALLNVCLASLKYRAAS